MLLLCWSPKSGTSRVSRKRLLEIRADAFERRVLCLRGWDQFAVWGAGRDSRSFISLLRYDTKLRIVAMLDVDPKKCGKSFFYSKQGSDSIKSIPIMHFTDFTSSSIASSRAQVARKLERVPVVVCVAKRRKGYGTECELEHNVKMLGLTEGVNLWYVM